VQTVDRTTETVISGQRVRSALSGEVMTFRRTSSETDGELVELDLELRPLGAPGGAPHRHIVAERFEITSGLLLVWIAPNPPRVVRPGAVFEVPPGRWHFVLALRRSTAHVLIRPGMRFDELLVVWAALLSGHIQASLVRRIVPLLRLHGCL
jgi:mannose-6-phosphate isomerase-like protein (cupin superfamily)